ncbi:MAG: hypothetical protein MJ118_09505 [Clostridia bacterium]|nr:hypothetical protein [Clostridia bacterium]
MNELKKRLWKLFSVKSIVTITLAAVFSVLALTDRVTPDQFMTIFSTVMAFYFGTQTVKDGGGTNE